MKSGLKGDISALVNQAVRMLNTVARESGGKKGGEE
jgi:hypothetical protein